MRRTRGEERCNDGAGGQTTFGVDNEALAGWDPDSQVRNLICVSVAKTSIERVPVTWEKSANVFQAPDLELMWPPQNLQGINQPCVLHM